MTKKGGITERPCERCKRPIVWARSPRGAWMAMQSAPAYLLRTSGPENALEFHADELIRPTYIAHRLTCGRDLAAYGERIGLLSRLATRALAEGWTLTQYERELARLAARGSTRELKGRTP